MKFNADDWVKAAKDAGMKYIVITSKHHDGFAMFGTQGQQVEHRATPRPTAKIRSKTSPPRAANTASSSVFIIRRRRTGTTAVPPPAASGIQAQEHDMDDYIDKIAVPQVKEICSNYGEFPAVIWWDTPRDMNYERAKKLYDAVKQLRPKHHPEQPAWRRLQGRHRDAGTVHSRRRAIPAATGKPA